MTIPWLIPELDKFQDEPQQLPSGTPGKVPFLHIGFEKRGERTEMVDVNRRAPLLVQRALYWDEALPQMPCIFITSSSGGILQGGHRCAIEIDVKPGAIAHVTTQAATKIHEMNTNYATQTQDIVVDQGAYLEYLPDTTIPFKNSRFVSKTRLSVSPDASLLYSEIIMPGRKYYGDGELFEYELFSSTVRAERPDGKTLFTEKFLIQPKLNEIRSNGVMERFDVFANVIFMTTKEHAERVFAMAKSEVDTRGQWATGVSFLPNGAGLIYKILGMESQPVKDLIRDFWKLVRMEVLNTPVQNEFIWR